MISSRVKTGILLMILAVAAMLTSCSEVSKGGRLMPATDKVSADEWKIISQKRILFGHQSVGNNILSGVKTLAGEAGVNLNIMDLRNARPGYGIIHFNIGQNGDPRSKIKDFADTLKSGAAGGADIALMKLCYVDIKRDTDAKKLAEDYINSFESLGSQFPKTVFVAVTVPLMTVQSGPKAFVKRLLGRELDGYAENFSRQEFNTILRDSCGRQGRLFDLARYEAGGAGSHNFKGQLIEVMNPAMSNDGGHLNSVGERIVATKLVKFLAASHL
jgi:hypothetical protein